MAYTIADEQGKEGPLNPGRNSPQRKKQKTKDDVLREKRDNLRFKYLANLRGAAGRLHHTFPILDITFVHKGGREPGAVLGQLGGKGELRPKSRIFACTYPFASLSSAAYSFRQHFSRNAEKNERKEREKMRK